MQIKILGEQPFQVLSTTFTIGPSADGYDLMFSADGVNYSKLFTVGANVNRQVTQVAAGSYYYLAGNTGNVVVNWFGNCVVDNGGGGGTQYTAGNGIQISGSAISVKAGEGLAFSGDTLVVSGGSSEGGVKVYMYDELFSGDTYDHTDLSVPNEMVALASGGTPVYVLYRDDDKSIYMALTDYSGNALHFNGDNGTSFMHCTLSKVLPWMMSGAVSDKISNYLIVDNLSQITNPYAGLEAYRREYTENVVYTGYTIDASQIDENYAAHIYYDGQSEVPVYHNGDGFHWDWDNDSDGSLRTREDFYYTINSEHTIISLFFNNPDAYVTFEEGVTTATTSTTLSTFHKAVTYRYNGTAWEEYQPPKVYYLDKMTQQELVALYNEIHTYTEETFPAGNYRFFTFMADNDEYHGNIELCVARFYEETPVSFSGIYQSRNSGLVLQRGYELASNGVFELTFERKLEIPESGIIEKVSELPATAEEGDVVWLEGASRTGYTIVFAENVGDAEWPWGLDQEVFTLDGDPAIARYNGWIGHWRKFSQFNGNRGEYSDIIVRPRMASNNAVLDIVIINGSHTIGLGQNGISMTSDVEFPGRGCLYVYTGGKWYSKPTFEWEYNQSEAVALIGKIRGGIEDFDADNFVMRYSFNGVSREFKINSISNYGVDFQASDDRGTINGEWGKLSILNYRINNDGSIADLVGEHWTMDENGVRNIIGQTVGFSFARFGNDGRGYLTYDADNDRFEYDSAHVSTGDTSNACPDLVDWLLTKQGLVDGELVNDYLCVQNTNKLFVVSGGTTHTYTHPAIGFVELASPYTIGDYTFGYEVTYKYSDWEMKIDMSENNNVGANLRITAL